MLTQEELKSLKARESKVHCGSCWHFEFEMSDIHALLANIEELTRDLDNSYEVIANAEQQHIELIRERDVARRQMAWVASLPCSCAKSSDEERNCGSCYASNVLRGEGK